MKRCKNAYIYIMYIMLFGGLLQGKAQTYTTDFRNLSITHKTPKWELPKGEAGLINAGGWNGFQSTYDKQIQNTHAFVDTIYMHKGQTIELALPDELVTTNSDGSIKEYSYSIPSYQRWYNYRTGGVFCTFDSNGKINKNLLGAKYPPSYTSGMGVSIFKNGYVGEPHNNGVPLTHMDFTYPTDTEFESTYKTTVQPDNKEYLVACDVSRYADYGQPNKLGNYVFTNASGAYEPTLSHRIIFVIRSIDDKDNHHSIVFNAQKTKPSGDDYLEHYEISMPFTRTPNKTDELVALAHDANSYVVPVKESDNPDAYKNDSQKPLTVKIPKETNSAGIYFVDKDGNQTNETEISGITRIIQFKYPDKYASNGLQHVYDTTDGTHPTSTILVTKTVNGVTYRIAKFDLTFNKATALLAETIINYLDTDNEKVKGTLWEAFKFRTPKTLQENKNYTLLTYLDFDDNTQYPGEGDYSTSPLPYEESSYAFFNNEIKTDDKTPKFPQWGYYAITKNYFNESGKPAVTQTSSRNNRKGEQSRYHMYVDASDRTGRIARLKFNNKLCRGSELFVTAWVKCSRNSYDKDNNAAILFTIMGVTEKDNQKTYTPIFRYQTGQIPTTYFKEEFDGKDGHNKIDIPGVTDATPLKNDWMQVYFSFLNKGEIKYDSYVLQVDNYSASTAGGDMYLDDIRVYMMPPRAEVKQKSYACNDDDATPLQMRIDWERLLSRSGETEVTGNDKEGSDVPITFCIVDSIAFHSAIAKGENAQTAFENAAQPISYKKEGDTSSDPQKYQQFMYKSNYTKNMKYKEKDVNIPVKDGTCWLSYLTDATSGERTLCADIYADLKPLHTYYLVMESNGSTDAATAGQFSDFYTNPTDICVAKTSFQIEAQEIIRINGEVFNENDSYCTGQQLTFKLGLKVNIDGTLQDVTQDVYYDWYFGSKADYEAIHDGNSEITVGKALIAFRADCPTAASLNEWTIKSPNDATLKALLEELVDTKKLILYRPSLNVHIPPNDKDMFYMMVRLTQTRITEGGQEYNVCAKPVEIALKKEKNLPSAYVGFHDVTYPDEAADADDTYTPVIRLGKEEHIDKIINTDHQLKVPLRKIGFSPGSSNTALGKDTNNPNLYLIESDDPTVLNLTSEDSFKDTDLPVAVIDQLQATQNGGDDNYLCFHFEKGLIGDAGTPEIVFREGFRYTLKGYFTETPGTVITTADEPITTACNGNLIFDLKVVPAYQRWIGDGTQNWNNDRNWKRSSAIELHKTISSEGGYDKEYDYTKFSYGFVPMRFTNVTVPESGQVQLYTPEKKTGSNDSHTIWDLSTSQVSDATPYIEFDLMVKEATATTAATNDAATGKVAFDCETYYTNTVDQIHFEPDAEMLHAERLTYNKAWVDYKLNGGQWYTLASPLQNVVAGDWYTLNTGQQTTEYFKDINFNTTDYSRFQPSVYQRGWKEVANMITIGSGSSNIDDNRTVAIAGNWSAVYNDVTVPYEPGQGFSVKVLNLPMTENNSSALFRFPKADTNYSYYQSENTTTGTNNQNITRSNPGELKSNELKDKDSFEVPLEAQNGESDYYLIGNPFMAHLNAQEFFNVNTNLQPKFWLVTEDNQSSAIGSTDNGWITTETGSKTAESPTIAPLQSFFVQKKTNSKSTEATTVTFKTDMQALGTTDTGLKSSSASFVSSVSSPVLTLTATTADGRRSRAAIAYDPAASDEYKANEDAELFLDSNLANIPAIYTVAGTMAASINRTPVLRDIPVGIYSTGNSSETVTLSFEGLDLFPGTTLYDAEKRTETTLYNGYTLPVPANTCGRYFLRAGIPTGNEKIETEAIRIYTVGQGQLIVAATENLQSVAIYDFAGRLLQRFDRLSDSKLTTHLDAGNYIVKAVSGHRQETGKIQIR